MNLLPPKYRPLDTPLSFQADIRIEEWQHGQLQTQSGVTFSQTIAPAPKQGWGDYCLLLERTVPEITPASSNPADEVVLLLTHPFLQLEVLLDASGTPQKLRNQQQIWHRWQDETYPAVTGAYSGDWVTAMVQQTEQSLLHPARTLDIALYHDWILAHYFAPFQQRSGTGSQPFLSYLAGSIPLAFREQWHAIPEAGEQAPALKVTGILARPLLPEETRRMLPEAVWKQTAEQPLLATKQAHYWLSPERGLWNTGFECTYRLTAGDDYEKRIDLKLLPA
ncbi:MAG: hypothetical protein EOP52_03185 [Sphingobacteriales bacterium]|nr:MAG: hypothetical protein EOP52_03185 [Sphingobacteriales bacterium]